MCCNFKKIWKMHIRGVVEQLGYSPHEAALKLVLRELQSLRHDTGVKPMIHALALARYGCAALKYCSNAARAGAHTMPI